jgi:hypothetical protein
MTKIILLYHKLIDLLDVNRFSKYMHRVSSRAHKACFLLETSSLTSFVLLMSYLCKDNTQLNNKFLFCSRDRFLL